MSSGTTSGTTCSCLRAFVPPVGDADEGDDSAVTAQIFIKRAAAATGFDDVAQIEAAFNETGVQFEDRKLVL